MKLKNNRKESDRRKHLLKVLIEHNRCFLPIAELIRSTFFRFSSVIFSFWLVDITDFTLGIISFMPVKFFPYSSP